MHEISNPVFWGKKGKCFNMSSAENFTQSAKHLFYKGRQIDCISLKNQLIPFL